MGNCFRAFIVSVIQATLKSDGKLVFTPQFFARHHGISSCREHLQLSKAPSSCREHPPVVESTLQLSGPGTYSCRKHPQLSGVSKEPTVVWTTYRLSRASSVVKSTFSYPKYLQLSRAPPVVQSTSSCREHLQLSRVPPAVENTSTCPKYLQLSRVIFVRQGASYLCTVLINVYVASPNPKSAILR